MKGGRERRGYRWDAVLARTAAPLFALLLSVGCSARGPGAEAYPRLADYDGAEVVALRFVAAAPFSADSLAELVQTQTTRCDLLGLGLPCLFGWGRKEAFLDVDVLASDVATLELFYRRNGFFGTRVVPDALERGEAEIAVQYTILRGDSILLDALSIEGVETVLDTARFRRDIEMEEGQLFNLDEFARAGNQLRTALFNEGYANAEVLRNYAVDTVANVASVQLIGVPGPQVRVDSIIVAGGSHLGRAATVRQLTLRQNDLLQPPALAQSQRNLFALDLVQFATVTIAPDSMQLTPADDSTETILVTVAEGPVYVVETAAGWGSVDCFRAQGSWTSRSFMGGARRLVVSGSLSKIGIGDPADLGLDGSICPAYQNDRFHSSLDYRLATDLTQPYFLSPNNRLSTTLFVERTSEPNLFQRQAYGADITMSRRVNLRDAATFIVSGQYRRTRASEAVFCFALAVCQASDLVGLQDFQFRNSFGASYTRDRTDRSLSPTQGYLGRVALEYAPAWLGSDINFLRGTAQASYYWQLREGWIIASHLQLGDFFGSADVLPDSALAPGDLLPPEERFYIGGASTVRGYERNSIGPAANPGIYVAPRTEVDPLTGKPVGAEGTVVFVPLGGTAMALANAELRAPSPFLSEYLRFAAFVDAGTVSAGSIQDIEFADLRVTPGVGLRIQTPVGPARIDMAYRPYPPYTAPLLGPDPNVAGRLIQIRPAHTPDESGFFRRLQFHLAVGHPF